MASESDIATPFLLPKAFLISMAKEDVTISNFNAFLYMRRCKNLDFLLKISNYLKACSANYFSPEHGVPHSWSPPRTPFGGCGRSVERQTLLFSHSVVSDSASPWTATQQASLFFTISWSLLRLMSIELVMPSNHLILCHPLLLMPSICLSIRVFSNESVLHIHVAKVLELQHQSFQWIFRTDFL